MSLSKPVDSSVLSDALKLKVDELVAVAVAREMAKFAELSASGLGVSNIREIDDYDPEAVADVECDGMDHGDPEEVLVDPLGLNPKLARGVIREFTKPVEMFSESVKKQHNWVLPRYLAWVKYQLEKNDPFSEDTFVAYAVSFIRMMALVKNCSYTTVNDVLVPSLRRLFKMKSGVSVSETGVATFTAVSNHV